MNAPSLRVVTTMHKNGYEAYGHRLLETWHMWPREAELHLFAEDFDPPPTERVVVRQLPDALTSFKEKWSHYRPQSFLFDVVRFSHKVYAATEGLWDWDRLGIWLDADCVMLQDLPLAMVEDLVPMGAFMALFKRPGLYSETGFWAMRGEHPARQSFLQTWRQWYEEGAFRQLNNWTDCETLDATIRRFERDGTIQTVSLTPKGVPNSHPMATSFLAPYVDHCKGPRKIDGRSPENPYANGGSV